MTPTLVETLAGPARPDPTLLVDVQAMTPAAMSRFWGRVDQSGDCWLWSGAVGASGYGRFDLKGRGRPAHRVSYAMAKGDIPDGLFVCHHCDNRLCVKPSHLFLGNNSDNMRDMVRKGRCNVPVGARVHNAILNDEMVVEIKRRLAKRESCTSIGKVYGVGVLTISLIKRGKAWKHVPDPMLSASPQAGGGE